MAFELVPTKPHPTLVIHRLGRGRFPPGLNALEKTRSCHCISHHEEVVDVHQEKASDHLRLLLHNAPQVALLGLDQVVGDVVVLPRQLLQDLIPVDRPIRWTRIEPVECFSDEPDLIRFTDSQVHHHLRRLNCHGLATWLMWSRSLQKRGLHVQRSDLPTTLTGLQQRCPNEHPIRPTCVGATRQTSRRWISLLRSQVAADHRPRSLSSCAPFLATDHLPRNQLRARRQQMPLRGDHRLSLLDQHVVLILERRPPCVRILPHLRERDGHGLQDLFTFSTLLTLSLKST